MDPGLCKIGIILWSNYDDISHNHFYWIVAFWPEHQLEFL